MQNFLFNFYPLPSFVHLKNNSRCISISKINYYNDDIHLKKKPTFILI